MYVQYTCHTRGYVGLRSGQWQRLGRTQGDSLVLYESL